MKRHTVNPEEVFDRLLNKETPDDYLERIRHKEIQHYTVQYLFSGQWAEIKVYPEWKKRSYVPKKGQSTREAQQRQNQRNAENKLCRILNHNFEPYKDVFVTFTCDNGHLVADMDAGFEAAEKAVRRIKYKATRSGEPFRAVYKIEIKRAKDSDSRYLRTADGSPLYRPHLHMVMNGGLSIKDLKDAWRLGHDKRVEMLRFDREGFIKLAKYLCKDTKEGRRRWNATRTIEQPPPPRTVYTGKAGAKSRVYEITVNENLRQDYFEKLLPGYEFVCTEGSLNEMCNGVFLHTRMCRR